MKKMLLTVLILTAFGNLHAATYKLDESHTTIGFKIKHLVISNVPGRFNKFNGDFKFDSKNKTIEDLNVTIDASSIDTNEPDRDKHLKSKDFFEVEKFKTLEFKSKSTVFKDKQPIEIKGDLTIHGVTKPVVLKADFKGEVTDPWGNQRIAFEAGTKLNRKDFGLLWNKTLDKGGVMVSEELEVVIAGEAIMQKDEAKKDEVKK